jgi:DNA primase
VSDYDRIKDRIDLLSIIEQETSFTMKGKHLSECPFCGGHGCFSIDREKGLYKCFQCPAEGDVFTFLENYHNVDKAEALRKAASFAGVSLTEYAAKTHADPKLNTKERIFIEAAAYYHANALKNGGKEYFLTSRGHKEASIEAMKCGWSDGGLVDHLTQKSFSDLEIKSSGLAKEITLGDSSKLLDFFGKGFAVFPHWEGGRVLHFTMKDPLKKHTYQLQAKARAKEWRFYNQGALSRFNEIIVVEGENDLLSVIDAGVSHVIGLIGQPSEEQIEALRRFCAKKHLYLWLDNDEDPEKPFLKGKGFIRKICSELAGEQNVRVITYPEEFKDPDDYLRGFKGDVKKEVRRLQLEAVDFTDWEISEIAKLDGLDNRLQALKGRRVFAALGEMAEIDRLVKSEKIEALGFTSKAIIEQIELNYELRVQLDRYRVLNDKKNLDPIFIAEMIYQHLSKKGLFFKTKDHTAHLFYRHFTYEIAKNLPFNALMLEKTNLQHTMEPGRSVWDALASKTYISGRLIDVLSWIYTDRETDSVFVNLNQQNNKIIKLSADGIEEVDNGLNKESVLLDSPWKVRPFNFLPDARIDEGMEFLSDKILNNFACERENGYLIICMFISMFLFDFVPYLALAKFSGTSASGKTTAAKLLSLLIYGGEHLSVETSGPAMYRVATMNPLLVLDNLETDNITKTGLNFLLASATKGEKEKAQDGSSSKTVEQMPKALIISTAIEPFSKPELINRTFDIGFHDRYKNVDFIEDDVIRDITKNRNIILSGILKFIQKDILPGMGKRKEYVTILKKEYRNHSKDRTDEYLALLMLILEKLVKYVPYFKKDNPCYGMIGEDDDIRKFWIEYQDKKAKDTETSTSTILKILDGIIAEYIMKIKALEKPTMQTHGEYGDVLIYQHPEYGLEMTKSMAESFTDENEDTYTRTYIEFVATSKDLVFAFDRFCRNNGIKNPYSSSGIFGVRLRNDLNLLKKGNWETIPNPKGGMDPYFKIVRGERFWKFKKTIVR